MSSENPPSKIQPYNGFPAGELRFTSVPDLFFTQVLPLIDSLSELKVTLHFLWLHHRQVRQVISREELLNDETLLQSLATISTEVVTVLNQALQQAVERGTLLHTQIEDNGNIYDWYFLNSERGRLALARLEAGSFEVVAKPNAETNVPNKRPNIFELYEANIGLIGPILADELKEAETSYPAEWITEAFKIAVENNARRWKYIETILEKWATAGRGHDQASKKKSWYTEEELQNFIQH